MQVQPSGQTGSYTVTGSTNLPNGTQMMVQAVRQLRPTSARLSNQEPIYAILARKQVEVTDGKWETTLSLRQATPGGQALETWQINRPQLGQPWTPETEVAFLAITDPVLADLEVDQASGTGTVPTENLVVRFTPDGRSFLQAEQVLSVAPPGSKVSDRPNTPSVKVVQVKASAGGDKTPKTLPDQNAAPVSAHEFLR